MLHSHSNHALMRQSANTQMTLMRGHEQQSSTASLARSGSPTSQLLYASSDETNITNMSTKFGRCLYPLDFLPDLPSPTACVRAASMPGQLDTPHQFKSTQTVCYQSMGDRCFAPLCKNIRRCVRPQLPRVQWKRRSLRGHRQHGACRTSTTKRTPTAVCT